MALSGDSGQPVKRGFEIAGLAQCAGAGFQEVQDQAGRGGLLADGLDGGGQGVSRHILAARGYFRGANADRWCLTSLKRGSEAVMRDMVLDARSFFQAISGIR